MLVRKVKKVMMLSLELMPRSTRDNKMNLKDGLRRDA